MRQAARHRHLHLHRGLRHGALGDGGPTRRARKATSKGFTMQRKPSPRLTLQLRAKVSKINSHLQAGRCVI